MPELEIPVAGTNLIQKSTHTKAHFHPELDGHPEKGRLPRRQTGDRLKGKNEN